MLVSSHVCLSDSVIYSHNGHEVDPPSFVFGGSNFLVGYSVLSLFIYGFVKLHGPDLASTA